MTWTHETDLHNLDNPTKVRATPCSYCGTKRQCVRYTVRHRYSHRDAVQLCLQCVVSALQLLADEKKHDEPKGATLRK